MVSICYGRSGFSGFCRSRFIGSIRSGFGNRFEFNLYLIVALLAEQLLDRFFNYGYLYVSFINAEFLDF